MNDALLTWGTALWIAAIVPLFFARAKALEWIFAINESPRSIMEILINLIWLACPLAGPAQKSAHSRGVKFVRKLKLIEKGESRQYVADILNVSRLTI
jgi:hypothetical protein